LALAARHRLDERDEPRPQRRENRLGPSRSHVGLELVQQRVVQLALRGALRALWDAEALGLLAVEVHRFLEPRQELREIRFLARFLPRLHAEARALGHLRDEARRQFRPAAVVALRLAPIRREALIAPRPRLPPPAGPPPA